MDISKILFIGLGGAGQRHLRVIHQIFGDKIRYLAFRETSKTPLLNSDFTSRFDTSLESLFGLELFKTAENALEEKPDLVFICNPTSMHAKYALLCLQAGSPIVVEKPFSNDLTMLDEVFTIAKAKNLAVHTSFQRRYHPVMQLIKGLLESKRDRIVSINFTTHSYVPNWHKYESYKELYACKKDLGGGVLLTEIHEIDLTVYFLGMPQSVFCSLGKRDYGLDVECSAILILEYNQFSVTIDLNMMSPIPRRSLVVELLDDCIEWNENQSHRMISTNRDDTEFPPIAPEELFLIQNKQFLQKLTFDSAQEINAVSSLKIVEAAKQSHQLARKVFL